MFLLQTWQYGYTTPPLDPCSRSCCRESRCGESRCGESRCGESCGEIHCNESPCGESRCGESRCGESQLFTYIKICVFDIRNTLIVLTQTNYYQIFTKEMLLLFSFYINFK